MKCNKTKCNKEKESKTISIKKDSWAVRDHDRGLVDQLEDRRLCKAEALGSNPSGSMSNNSQTSD